MYRIQRTIDFFNMNVNSNGQNFSRSEIGVILPSNGDLLRIRVLVLYNKRIKEM